VHPVHLRRPGHVDDGRRTRDVPRRFGNLAPGLELESGRSPTENAEAGRQQTGPLDLGIDN
jgi:hypothetical protein